MGMFDWLLGKSNPKSITHKDKTYFFGHVLMTHWTCPSCKSEHNIPGGVDTRKWVDCEKCNKKPHYKWSWKLNKAVRV